MNRIRVCPRRNPDSSYVEALVPANTPASLAGNSNLFQIINAKQKWYAGYTGAPCDVSIGEWSDGRISFQANIASKAVLTIGRV